MQNEKEVALATRDQLVEKIQTQAEVINELSTVDPEYQTYVSKLSEKQIRRVTGSVRAMRNGLYAVAPLVCGGPGRCIFFDRCPIPEVDATGKLVPGPEENYPIGRSCLLERLFMQQKVIEYIQHLDVDPSNPIEMAIINDLAVIDLYKYRAVAILSSGDKDGHGQDFMRVDVVGFNEESGAAAYTTHTHPAMEVIDQLERRRDKIIDKLNETRKAKFDIAVKLGQKNETNEVLAEIAGLRNELRKIAEGEVIELNDPNDGMIMLEGAI